jgi:hypothetical protein
MYQISNDYLKARTKQEQCNHGIIRPLILVQNCITDLIITNVCLELTPCKAEKMMYLRDDQQQILYAFSLNVLSSLLLSERILF